MARQLAARGFTTICWSTLEEDILRVDKESYWEYHDDDDDEMEC